MHLFFLKENIKESGVNSEVIKEHICVDSAEIRCEDYDTQKCGNHKEQQGAVFLFLVSMCLRRWVFWSWSLLWMRAGMCDITLEGPVRFRQTATEISHTVTRVTNVPFSHCAWLSNHVASS